MSELINNSEKRKALLKHMIMQIHGGEAPEEVNRQLINLMKKVPYGEVVEVEQELISEGILSDQEVLKFCDLHTKALEGNIDLSGMKIVPPGHPVDTFRRENRELEKVVRQLEGKYKELPGINSSGLPAYLHEIRSLFNALMDVEKHYLRKENLLFPFLEKYGITGPPKVMWGKHDETRELLRAAIESLGETGSINKEETGVLIDMVLLPASTAVSDMIMKEEEILLPMSLDKLTENDWYDIYVQTPELGFCLYDPDVEWNPGLVEQAHSKQIDDGIIRLPSGSFTREELQAILNSIPFDITFVGKDEKVKYFSQGKERIFPRNRAILNRDVKMCHPPSSVGIVEQILNDFREGREERAPFWIQMQGKFIHIEYFALRNDQGEFLGTLEVSQDLTDKRKLEGEQRILSYKRSS